MRLTCATCERPFERLYKISARRAARPQFCSRQCVAVRNAGRADVLSRLWSRVSRGGPDDCWPWTGRVDPNGYGRIDIAGKPKLAHRAVFFAENPDANRGGVVCHRCDNPACCNPAHLWLGTQADNVADMDAKGRRKFGPVRRGEDASKTRLTKDQAIAVFVSTETNRSLARQYGVTETAIYNIKTGRSWAHATEDLR